MMKWACSGLLILVVAPVRVSAVVLTPPATLAYEAISVEEVIGVVKSTASRSVIRTLETELLPLRRPGRMLKLLGKLL